MLVSNFQTTSSEFFCHGPVPYKSRRALPSQAGMLVGVRLISVAFGSASVFFTIPPPQANENRISRQQGVTTESRVTTKLHLLLLSWMEGKRMGLVGEKGKNIGRGASG
jgi:hypothetical protein